MLLSSSATTAEASLLPLPLIDDLVMLLAGTHPRPPPSTASPLPASLRLTVLPCCRDGSVSHAGRGAELEPDTPASALSGILPSEACRSGLVRELLAVKGAHMEGRW